MEMIDLKNLTIDFIHDKRDHHECFAVHNPEGDLFQHPIGVNDIPMNSLMIDMQSANVIVLIYDALKPDNKALFNSVLQDEYKFASFLDKMWKFVA